MSEFEKQIDNLDKMFERWKNGEKSITIKQDKPNKKKILVKYQALEDDCQGSLWMSKSIEIDLNKLVEAEVKRMHERRQEKIRNLEIFSLI